MKKMYFLIALMIPVIAFAQQRVGNLTVFSEDGDKFFLVLNGEKQNEIAESNIRIEELPQPYYSAKIIFADPALAPISKSNLMITDAEGTMMDVTYRIRKDKSNKTKMNPYSAIPVQNDFIAPSGMFVRHWGQPSPVQTGGIRQTTTTTTTNTMGASVSVPGMNVNINITDPIDSHTTTTTTTSTNVPQQQTIPTRGCSGMAMGSSDFNAAKRTISESSFDDTKLTTAKSIVGNNCMSTDQIVQICNLFSFEESKLAFAKHAFPYCTDQKNYFKVNNVFSFSSSKESLSEFIGGN